MTENEIARPSVSGPDASINRTPCPSCSAGPGTLRIVERLAFTDGSLAGAQVKFAARGVLVLLCSACPLEREGFIGPDGKASFARGGSS